MNFETIQEKLAENNYRYGYILIAYTMYTMYGVIVGAISAVVDHNIYNLLYGFIIGSIVGIYVAYEVYCKY